MKETQAELPAFEAVENEATPAGRIRARLRTLFPPVDRADRIALFKSLTEGSHWNVNFGMMLGCSVIIAGLGLLQDSVAVIIGAMLVAPLMTPLIGIGLALVQGNFDLLTKAARSMLIGTVVGLALGFLLRVLTPGHEVTTQVTIRGAANILDLLIAFFAGIAAGYAMARPKLSGALPGVAIAVALVLPLTAAGIAFGSFEWTIGFGALLLYLTNLIAIVLASAVVFRLHGIKTPTARKTSTVRMKRILVITTERVVPGSLIAELDQLINEGMGTDIDVKINVLRQGEVGKLPAGVTQDFENGPATAVNE